jgi:hypothetical protein
MTHSAPVPESDGDLTVAEASERVCKRCGSFMAVQAWHSHCGGFVDHKYTCACGAVEWVDGIDS